LRLCLEEEEKKEEEAEDDNSTQNDRHSDHFISCHESRKLD
jgi:hypothetical protein